MMKKTIYPFFVASIIVFSFVMAAVSFWGASTVKEGDKTYIVDMTGERWDVSQAVTLGFDPGGFQYGIGKNAFTTLDDSYLTEGGEPLPEYLRVIGVDDGKSGKAYSVRRLSRHEISNSELGSDKVAVAY